MEARFHQWLQVQFQHHLRDSVSHGGNTERPFPAIRLRYLYRPDWRREVRPR